MAARLDLEIDQGVDFELPLTITDNNDDPVDLTSAIFTAHAKVDFDSPTLFSFTFTIENQTTDIGKVKMSVDADTTSALKGIHGTKFFYDVKMENAGVKTRELEGVITLRREV